MSDIAPLRAQGEFRPAQLDNLPAVPSGQAPEQPADSARDARLRATAVRFEAAFLAEMLRHSGLGQMPATFNGGAGESAFTGSLIQEYATAITRAGGIGLADSIFKSLIERGAE